MSGQEAAAGTGVKPGRLASLDAFRGFVIASMLLVNTTFGEEGWGTGWWRAAAEQLAHVAWNDPVQGATFTDMVFPWFLFIMGAAVPLSMRSGRGRATPGWRKVSAAARRGVVIYLLGVLLTGAGAWLERPAAWTDLLSWNILQLIGVAYVAVVVVGLTPRWAWWGFVGVVLVLKWGLMLGIDAAWLRETLASGATPLAPRSDGGPGGFGTFTHFDDVKRFVNGEHLAPGWLKSTVGWLGMSQQWLVCAAIGVMGALSVDRLMHERGSAASRAAVVLVGGLAAIGLALLLSWGYGREGGGLLGPMTVPQSKWFFSPAYCLMSAGTGAVLLAVFYLVVDGIGWRWAAEPWRTYGVNAIALYVGAELSFKLAFSRWLMPTPWGEGSSVPGAVNAWVASWLPDGEMIGGGASALRWASVSGLAFAALWLAGWWMVCRWMDRRGVYVRV